VIVFLLRDSCFQTSGTLPEIIKWGKVVKQSGARLD
jgi:hypothetical protein